MTQHIFIILRHSLLLERRNVYRLSFSVSQKMGTFAIPSFLNENLSHHTFCCSCLQEQTDLQIIQYYHRQSFFIDLWKHTE